MFDACCAVQRTQRKQPSASASARRHYQRRKQVGHPLQHRRVGALLHKQIQGRIIVSDEIIAYKCCNDTVPVTHEQQALHVWSPVCHFWRSCICSCSGCSEATVCAAVLSSSTLQYTRVRVAFRARIMCGAALQHEKIVARCRLQYNWCGRGIVRQTCH